MTRRQGGRSALIAASLFALTGTACDSLEDLAEEVPSVDPRELSAPVYGGPPVEASPFVGEESEDPAPEPEAGEDEATSMGESPPESN